MSTICFLPSLFQYLFNFDDALEAIENKEVTFFLIDSLSIRNIWMGEEAKLCLK